MGAPFLYFECSAREFVLLSRHNQVGFRTNERESFVGLFLRLLNELSLPIGLRFPRYRSVRRVGAEKQGEEKHAALAE